MSLASRFFARFGLNNNSNTITNVADPVGAQDAATKNYAYAKAGDSLSGQMNAAGNIILQPVLKDPGYTFLDLGTVSSGSQALSYSAAPHQRLQVGAAITLTLTNFPATTISAALLLELVNGAAFSITWPTINWITANGSTTTSFASNGVTLQTSGTDWVVIWTRDGGTTYYGKIIR